MFAGLPNSFMKLASVMVNYLMFHLQWGEWRIPILLTDHLGLTKEYECYAIFQILHDCKLRYSILHKYVIFKSDLPAFFLIGIITIRKNYTG